jgi:hypothetical protein
MKTIIKIVVGLAIITASFNAARAAFADYQFQDAVQQGLLFNPRAQDAEIVAMVLKMAQEFEVPIDADGITVHMVGQDRRVDMSYTTNVVLVPGVFGTDWTFEPYASTRILTGGAR